jgi:hypothetical protein
MHFDPEKITFFGRTDARGQNVAFGIKAKDRQRHVYVIGKTGMGKSTLLENMAVQDIQNGEGMAFIDPHGSAAETLLNYIPPERVNDVLYFAPADVSFPVSFNIMEDVGADKRHLVVSGLMSVFKKIFVDAWSARMEYILSNTILALLEYPGSTLLGVNRMLSDKKYREMIVNNVKDPGVKAFWVDEFAKYNERYMQEAGDAIKNKIGQFTANPVIRNIIGQPKSSFDIRKMMDERKIIIMNLSKGLIGETNANLLGSMLTTRIYLAAMSRADISPEKMKTMPNFYFYVDEFQSFANATFANILSEARKYHLNLTIAHQYIEQMEEDVRNAVFGNVGTIISFRVGPFDAEILETIFTPQFLATDIVNLGFAQVYLTLMIDGIGSTPFSATTLPPIAPQVVTYKDMVIASSRRMYGRLRAEVEEEIVKFHEPIVIERPRIEKPFVPIDPMSEKKESVKEPSSEKPAASPSPSKEIHEERRKEPEVREKKETSFNPRGEDRRKGERRDTAPRSNPTTLPPKKDSKDHLADLRSILKKVVTEETPKPKPVEKNETPTPPPPRAATPVPQQSSQTPTPQPKVVPEEKKEIPKIGEEESRAALKTALEEVKPVRESPKSASSPSVSPKELERMMRITLNDKPPF